MGSILEETCRIMQLPIGLVVLLLLGSGLLLSRIRFCMVAAVDEARQGNWGLTKAITLISLMISAVLLLYTLAGGEPSTQVAANRQVILGGVIFGLAAAWNQACFISTSVQLTAGELNALWPVAGWLIGFRLMAAALPPTRLHADGLNNAIALLVLAAALGGLLLRDRRTASEPSAAASPASIDWRASVACGLMLGFVDNDLWLWNPSALARQLAHPHLLALHWGEGGAASLLGLVLLLGMALNALLQHRFKLRPLQLQQWRRLPCGIGMAIGATLAMGGNDTQLLRYLPGGSPHTWLALPAMAAGILLGLSLAKWRRRMV